MSGKFGTKSVQGKLAMPGFSGKTGILGGLGQFRVSKGFRGNRQVMDVCAQNVDVCTKNCVSCGSDGHLGVRVRNVRKKSGPFTFLSFPDQGFSSRRDQDHILTLIDGIV